MENDIREIREEEYSMENEMAGGKPQIIAGGKNEKLSEEKIPFREIRKDEYRKMKNDIREINEEGYSMEMKNDNEKLSEEKIHIKEMNEEGNSMMENEINEINEMEREFDNDEMENEINDEMYNEEEYMENKIGNKILRDPKLERTFYEDDKLIYQINNIYRKYGLKINKNSLRV